MQISRRFFLGSAISLVAAQTFVPSVSAMINLPTIYGDGKTDDSYGLGALFRNEPVIFKKDQLAIDSHGGITFHRGEFLITQPVRISKDVDIFVNQVLFRAPDLDLNLPMFIMEAGDNRTLTDNRNLILELPHGHHVPLFAIETNGKWMNGNFKNTNKTYDEYHPEFGGKREWMKA